MKKSTTMLLAFGAIAAMASSAVAQTQAPTSSPSSTSVRFAVFAGVALPHGDENGLKTGYTVGGGLDVRSTQTPLGLRGEILYSGLDMKDSGGATDQGMTDFGANMNGTFWLSGAGIPIAGYLTAGPSYAHVTYSGTSGQLSGYETQDHWGLNAGGGIEFPLGSLTTRLDVRYREISLDGGGTFKTVPITFGITF